MYHRFTNRARNVMQLANQEAQRTCSAFIGTEHILIGMVKEGSGLASTVLANFALDLRYIREAIERLAPSDSRDESIRLKIPHTPSLRKMLDEAARIPQQMDHGYIGTEHLLLGMIADPDCLASKIIVEHGTPLEKVREELMRLFQPETFVEKWPTEYAAIAKVLSLAEVQLEAALAQVRLTQQQLSK